MKTYVLLFSLFTGVMFISCSEDDDQNEEPVPTGTLRVANQVYENGKLTIHHVKMNRDGWVAIYRFSAHREELLGYTFIEAGEHEDVEVELDNNHEVHHEETLQALLHLDVNGNKIFDWGADNNIDVPLKNSNQEVFIQFSVMIVGENWISVEDQEIVNNSINVRNLNLEYVSNLIESDTAWLVAYTEEGWGYPSNIIGVSDVLTISIYDNLKITLDDSVRPGDTIWLVLHNDTGVKGVFNQGEGELDQMVWNAQNDFIGAYINILY